MRYLKPILILSVTMIAAAAAGRDDIRIIPSNVTLFDHPLHPMLVVFPLALFPTALLFDIIYALRKDGFWFRAASNLILFGLIGAVLSAITGLIDYFTVVPGRGGVHETAELHLIVNLIAVGTFAANYVIRLRRAAPYPPLQWLTLILSIVGVLLITYSGYLGADLAHEHGVGLIPED